MKKFASFLMVFAMLASLLVVAVSAEQTNMEVTIPKFSAQPIFDGCVSVEEWGEATVHMVTDGAATVDDLEIGANEEFGLKNIFYWFTQEGISDALSYDLWLRWDDQFLYVAAIVNDPDPFSLPTGGEEIWNGDMLQIRVDEAGPSAVMLKENPEFNYKTDSFNGGRFKKPWSNDTEVFNGILGLVQGDTPTIWRAGKVYGEGWNMAENGGLVGITYVQHEDDTCTTQYEGAIPWSVVNETLVPKAGDVYGVAVSVACSDSNSLNAWLQWGHGVTSVDENVQPRETRGGSQAMVLSDETIAPEEGHPIATAAPETTEAPVEIPTVPAPTNPVGTGDVEGTGDAQGTEDGTKAETNDKPADTDKDDEGGLSTGVIIGIVAAVVVVIAVVAIVIVKKKK